MSIPIKFPKVPAENISLFDSYTSISALPSIVTTVFTLDAAKSKSAGVNALPSTVFKSQAYFTAVAICFIAVDIANILVVAANIPATISGLDNVKIVGTILKYCVIAPITVEALKFLIFSKSSTDLAILDIAKLKPIISNSIPAITAIPLPKTTQRIGIISKAPIPITNPVIIAKTPSIIPICFQGFSILDNANIAEPRTINDMPRSVINKVIPATTIAPCTKTLCIVFI